MASHSDQLDSVYNTLGEYADGGIIFRQADDERLDGRTIVLGGRRCINFGSCSYLGLELDPRVRRGAIEAIERYGTQFSSSRGYVSAPPYTELQELIEEIFGGPALILPNTTLAHLTSVPILVHEDDVVILDHWVHTTVRLAVDQVRLYGAKVEVIPHSDLERLDERVRELRGQHRRVWYFADGVYSMRGDFAPIPQLVQLLDRHPELHLYVDDAHGVGWFGKHGRGYVLDQIPSHPRMFVAVSLNKCFGAGGGAVIFPDEESRRRVRTLGGPIHFTGPIQPPSLGAAVAAARIFLSDQMAELQAAVRQRIELFNETAREAGLPIFGNTRSPIRFVPFGWPRCTTAMVREMLERGFWTNLAVFPAVLPKQAGVRATMTLHQTEQDVKDLVAAMASRYDAVLEGNGSSREEMAGLFKLPTVPGVRNARRPEAPGLVLEEHESIAELDAAEWDRLLGSRGVFSARGLRLFEESFRNNGQAENEWKFHYWIVRDEARRPLLATFFTETVWKDDMVASSRVSKRIEERRADDPYYLTSRVLTMGCLLTEGNHLFLEREGDWRGALSLLLRRVTEVASETGARTVALRDLSSDDREMDEFLRGLGFAKVPLPGSMVLEIDWKNDEEFLIGLKRKARTFQRREVLPFEASYEVEVWDSARGPLPEEVWSRLHELYRNVRDRNLAINTFELPEKVLRHMGDHPDWEVVLFRRAGRDEPPCAFLAGFRGAAHYSPLLVGLDYRYVRSEGLYRRCLLEMMRRAQELGVSTVYMGMGAHLEKRRFGAERRMQSIYVRSDDHYQLDVLSQVEADAAVSDDDQLGDVASSSRTRAVKVAAEKGLERYASRAPRRVGS